MSTPRPAPFGGDGRLRVTVLGCDGSWPGAGGAGSGYLVRSPGAALLVDAGPGTFAALQGLIDPTGLDAVFISHQHADHWSDLPHLATFLRFASPGRVIPVLAPNGLAEHVRLAGAAAFGWRTVSEGDTVDIGDLECRFRRTDHAGETLALRVDGAACALGYSSDTGPAWSLAALGPDLDLVLCEATYTLEHEGTAGHMSGRQAGAQARRSGIPRLVLTHRWPTISADAVLAEAHVAYGGAVEQAVAGREFQL